MGKESNLSEYRPIRVALLGAGSVGSEVARLLLEQKSELAARVGAELELVGVAVRDLKTKRNGFPKEPIRHYLQLTVQNYSTQPNRSALSFTSRLRLPQPFQSFVHFASLLLETA